MTQIRQKYGCLPFRAFTDKSALRSFDNLDKSGTVPAAPQRLLTVEYHVSYEPVTRKQSPFRHCHTYKPSSSTMLHASSDYTHHFHHQRQRDKETEMTERVVTRKVIA